MSQNKRRNDFVKQAGILAGAGIIVRIIGILYRSPLTSIIGDEGNGYYGAAYNIYTIILLLSSYSIPSAISKVIAQKMAVGEYRNAHRIFRNAFLYVCVVGGAASLLTFLLAGGLVGQNGTLNADTLRQAFGDDVLRVHINQLIFEGRAARVYHKNLHKLAS